MGKGLKSVVVLMLALASARGHLAWPEGELQQVQGLYIKPSSDGTTGDLYVAATENNGVSQWLTDAPVNLLPPGSHLPSTTNPLITALLNNALPTEQSESASPQKRSAITGQAAKYAFGLPESYQYAYAGVQSPKPEAAPASTKAELTPPPAAAASAVLQYPYQYLYPHMMHAAYASALKVLKEAGTCGEDESKNNAISHSHYPASYWPASYYPMQYIVMDPTAWVKSQIAATTTTTTAATTTESDDDDEEIKPE